MQLQGGAPGNTVDWQATIPDLPPEGPQWNPQNSKCAPREISAPITAFCALTRHQMRHKSIKEHKPSQTQNLLGLELM